MYLKIFLRSLGFIAIFCLISFLYLRHFDDIGKMPAESIEYSASDSRVWSLEKERVGSDACRLIAPRSNTAAKNESGRIEIFGPSIPLIKVDQELLDLVDRSYIFMVHDGRLYAADEVKIKQAYGAKIQGYIQGNLLQGWISANAGKAHFVEIIQKDTYLTSIQLIERGYVTKSSMELLEKQTKNFYSRCPTISKNEKLAVTEYFWATEGRSSVHHWVHFYEGAILGTAMRAQYGVILPALTRAISSFMPGDGPTQYISVAWTLFYLSALSYCFLLLYIFKENPATVIVFLFIKIILFINLGDFIIFTAPGTHWFRELNFLLIYIISNYYIFFEKKCRYHSVPILLLFLLTLLLDPMSGFFGWTAVFLSYAINLYKNNQIKITEKNIITSVAIFIFLIIIFIVYNDNAQYFFSMVSNNVFSNNLSDQKIRYLLLNGLILFLMVIFYLQNKLNYKYIYFAFLGNISIIYYLMTPDWVHYYKYLEYVIIFYMCFFIFSYNLIISNINKFSWLNINVINFLNDRSIKFLKLTLLVIVFLIILSHLIKFNKINNESPLTVLYGADGHIFFDSYNYTINGKKISANISRGLADHLDKYPSKIGNNFIVSNFDKYLLFLYNKKNNFGYIDLRTQVVDDGKMNKIISAIKNNGGKFIVDQKNFKINPEYGPKISGDSILIEGNGQYFLGPYNSIKSQLRMAKISEYIHNNCSLNYYESNNDWYVYNCSALNH